MHREIQKPLEPVAPESVRAGAVVGAYLSLTKPRIISLLLLVTLATMILAARTPLPAKLVVLTLVGGALMSGAANALNCFLDRDIDRIMSRTRHRPLVTGIISPVQALTFGVVLAVVACIVLVVGAGLFSAALALAGLLVYVFFYTPLKRRSPWSVVVGAIAGAAPPLVAWVAVRHSLDATALILFAVMALWQIPHTLALTLLLYNDYFRAGVPVSPVAGSIQRTRREIVGYSCLLWGLSLVPAFTGFFGPLYRVGAALLGARFTALAADGLFGAEGRPELRLYKYSLLYLAALFAIMTLDGFLHNLGIG